MALRSGAGTGVLVSLVVFIFTTVFLLVMTIVFYGGLNNEKKAHDEAEDALEVYITSAERNSDRFQQIEAAAKIQGRVSVARYLTTQMEDVMSYVDGNPTTSLEALRANFSSTVGDDGVIKTTFNDMQRTLQKREDELDNANQHQLDIEARLAEKDALMVTMRKQQEEQISEIMKGIKLLESASEDYRSRVDRLAQKLESSREELRDNYEGQIDDLESEIEQISQDFVVVISRLNELQSRLDTDRIKPEDPATLVDGRIIDTLRGSDQVFINRGRRDHIVRGMTFEVYDDHASIRMNPRTGQFPRGKASLQVIDVGDSSSTCKITRSVPGRPVVRDNVIVNAIYDPEYRFKFLVHGKFDIDLDGRPTEAEAEFLRSLVIEWGGEVIIGDALPGNLDFLILGEQPPKSIEPPPDAPDHIFDDWLRMNTAHEKYNELKRQAMDAQIPLLNSNRFLILIGHTQR